MMELDVPKKNKSDFDKLVKLLKERNYKKATEYTYLRYNLDFLLFINKPASKVTTKDLDKYIEHLRQKKVSSSTIQINISSLKMFFEEVLAMDIFDHFQRPAREYKTPQVLDRKDIGKLLNQAETDKAIAISGLLYYAGLRVGELIQLQWKNVDFKKKELDVNSPIPTQSRKVPIEAELVSILKKYQKETNGKTKDFLFPGKVTGKPITPRNVERFISDLSKEAGISASVTVFMLRHSRAIHMLADGKTLEDVRKFLGHKSIATTESYLPIKKNLRPKVRQKYIQEALADIRKKYKNSKR